MAPTFPLPRALLPTLDASPEESAAAKRMMDALLRHTVREYARLRVDALGAVDTQRWKPVASHERLAVFREREGGSMGASVARELRAAGESLLMPNRDAVAALRAPCLLLTGSCAGRVENAMFAVVTETHDDLALVVKFLHEDVADCAILSTMEGPTAEQPHRFLGYKYFVRKSPTEGRMFKHRDSLYLESSGYTRCPRTGEPLGFHLMHSVDLPDFPSLTARNSVRALQSVRYLYRQRSADTVDVFMLGNLDVAGSIVRPIANMFAMTTLFGIARLPACAEARRLTSMAKRRVTHYRHHGRSAPTAARSTSCCVCQGRGGGGGTASGVLKLIGAGTPHECYVCGQLVCARCRRSKRVFAREPQGVLGEFRKVSACSACVLAANAGFAPLVQCVSESPTASPSNVASDRHGMKTTRAHPWYHSSSSGSDFSGGGIVDDSMRFSHSTVSSLSMSDDMERPVTDASDVMERLRMAAPTVKAGGWTRRGTVGRNSARRQGSDGKASMNSDLTWSTSSEDASSSFASSSIVSRPSTDGPGRPQEDLYARLQELQRSAEAAYNMARQNTALLLRQQKE